MSGTRPRPSPTSTAIRLPSTTSTASTSSPGTSSRAFRRHRTTSGRSACSACSPMTPKTTTSSLSRSSGRWTTTTLDARLATRRTGSRRTSCPVRCARPSARSSSPAPPAGPAARSMSTTRCSSTSPDSRTSRTASPSSSIDQVRLLRDRIRYGDANTPHPVEQELRALWERDFVPTSAWFPADQAPGLAGPGLGPGPAQPPRRSRSGSSTAPPAMPCSTTSTATTGLSVIAIGGNKLSRGLTLEGLSVSYYLRASKTYDTLLQMGRWFGYRPGYEDLCRLYTTPALPKAYAEITAANDELRREFEEMAALDAKPEDFGLRVRASPAGLAVTAREQDAPRAKGQAQLLRRHPRNCHLRSAGLVRCAGTSRSWSDSSPGWTRPIPDTEAGSSVWTGVPAEEIVDGFLAEYVPTARRTRVGPAFIAKYIRLCQRVGELGSWTVRLVSSQPGEQRRRSARTRSASSSAHPINDTRPQESGTRIRRVLSPTDESTDLGPGPDGPRHGRDTQGRRRKARQERQPEEPEGSHWHATAAPAPPRPGASDAVPTDEPAVGRRARACPAGRDSRSASRSRNTPTETEYVVNEIWQQQAFDEPDERRGHRRMTITEQDWDAAGGRPARRTASPSAASIPDRRTTSSSPSGTRTAAACSPSGSARRQRASALRRLHALPRTRGLEMQFAAAGRRQQRAAGRAHRRRPAGGVQPAGQRHRLDRPGGNRARSKRCSPPPAGSSTGGACWRASRRRA